MASLRMFSDAGLTDYPHNCFISIDYPLFRVARLKAMPLYFLAYELTKYRLALPRACDPRVQIS